MCFTTVILLRETFIQVIYLVSDLLQEPCSKMKDLSVSMTKHVTSFCRHVTLLKKCNVFSNVKREATRDKRAQ